MIGQQIVDEAMDWLGVPFKHAGRNRFGVDCAGLLLVVAHELKLTDWDCVNYSRTVDCGFLRECIERFCDPLEEYSDPGDVLLFNIGRQPQHLAIYAGEGQMIHAHESAGMVVRHWLDHFWQRRLVGAFRWRA